ncbi:DUF928 domain-containing protein [Leptothoe sp. PORK10 BA2]|uniref:DUF928 domain-containing protein n=1 Tax=Leptothoe sp. PORK10 BA2 TaxID=3110254 RepID=UPI002B1F1775|nr:DUF928 domain-containing protein [Leptothoe sp. PORK10 BA2]MEA5464078.1 DUF928 domain-containing protein [Leptothoe sp. PORK10 BA2]
MKQLLKMHKPGFAIARLSIGSLIYLLFTCDQPSWGHQASNILTSKIEKPLALATAMRKSYSPPANPTPPNRTTGGGTRGGCDSPAAISLTALAPQAHAGQTASTWPTLTWYIADENPYPVQLQLYRYTSSNPVETQLERVHFFDLGPSQPGWMSFTLPTSLPPLNVGETYRWKVILQCSASQPSKNKIDEADLQVVPLPIGMVTTTDPVQQAQQFAAAGLWYDAIAVISQSSAASAVAYRRDLVASLAELEAENPNDQFSQLSNRLRYIATQD